MKKKKIDIMDILPPEAVEKIDELGYTFLAENGYDTKNASKSAEKRKEIKSEMKKKGEELRYFGAVDNEKKQMIFWYELYRNGEKVCKSRGLKMVREEGKNGEQKNRESEK